MKRSTKIAGAVLGLVLAAAFAAPWLIPTQALASRIAHEAGVRLGTPVNIAGVRIALLPTPHVSIEGIDAGAGAVTAHSIAVYPGLLSLLSEQRVLRSIELEGVTVSRKGSDLIGALLAKPRGNSPGSVDIERVRGRNIVIEIADGRLPAFHAELDLAPGPMPIKQALVTTVDGQAKLTMKPAADAAEAQWTVTFVAREWQVPVGPALRFNQLTASGRLRGKTLELPELAAVLYGGSIKGSAQISWQKGWRVSGDARATGIDIPELSRAFKVKGAVSGKLEASGPFSAQASTPAGLADAVAADIQFDVRNGVLHGFDLASAAQNLLKGGAGGGSTPFDQLTGRVKVLGRAYKLQHLQVASGVLKASGNVDVSASKQLSGRIDTEVKGTAGLVGVPLAVSGTLDQPQLLPTKGSMAGAVVGSVLLPGVGTSIGSSVGDKLGRLLGK